MEEFHLYKDIKARTGGEIFLGVVGPVRTGKSTFVRHFMELLVLPNLKDNEKKIATDELPTSGKGKTITTVEPKFVPKEAALLRLPDQTELKVRLVDISLGGLMFRSKEEFRVDDKFNIVIPAMGDTMLFSCEVRRQVERPDGEYGYGCEFMDMATQQEDLLYRYILKRQSDQLRRIR